MLRHYVHGLSAGDDALVWYEGATLRMMYMDAQGSVVRIDDSAGNTIGVNAYDEYGVPDANNIGRFGYTGQTWVPELGLWYYKARMYSPTLGRFMQTDPIGYADGMDIYAYTGGDPVNGLDYLGLKKGGGCEQNNTCAPSPFTDECKWTGNNCAPPPVTITVSCPGGVWLDTGAITRNALDVVPSPNGAQVVSWMQIPMETVQQVQTGLDLVGHLNAIVAAVTSQNLQVGIVPLHP